MNNESFQSRFILALEITFAAMTGAFTSRYIETTSKYPPPWDTITGLLSIFVVLFVSFMFLSFVNLMDKRIHK